VTKWTKTEYKVLASMAPSHHRTNNIVHDNDEARKLGFRAGLITGTTIYGYASHLPVANWGVLWLTRGTAMLSLRGPTFEGEGVAVRASESKEAADTYEVEVTSVDPGPRMLMRASLRSRDAAPELRIPRKAANATMPELTRDLLATGTVLPTLDDRLTEAEMLEYLEQIQEASSIYRTHKLVHPGQLLHLANESLMQNFTLEPWYHVKTELEYHSPVAWDEPISIRARVVEPYERHGSELVTIDYEWVADESRLASRARHTLMYHRNMASAKG